MMERISSGENLLGFNIFNSYAALRAKKDPSIGIVLPKDYALVMSRVMFISKTAKNPNAGKLWLDYILSKRGQTIIANQSELGSIRADVEGEMTLAGYTKQLGAAANRSRSAPTCWSISTSPSGSSSSSSGKSRSRPATCASRCNARASSG